MNIFKNTIGSILYLICTACVCLSFGCSSKRNDLYLISPSVLKIDVKKGTTYESEVFIKNLGSNKLNILEISTSCGCTVGVLQDSVLRPSDSVSLKIRFTPTKVDTGEIIRFVSLRTNGTPPVKSLEIRSKIISE